MCRSLFILLLLLLSSRVSAQFTTSRFHESPDIEVSFNSAIASAGDLNGDGVEDLIVGSPGKLSVFGLPPVAPGQVSVFSGADGSLLHFFAGDVAGGQFGFAVDNAGDLNNDDVPDIIVGQPGWNVAGAERGRVFVFSGLTGNTIMILNGTNPEGQAGRSVAGMGDLNGDGVDDLAIAEPRATDGGKVRVVSGMDGSLIRTHQSMPSFRMGESIANAGDVNGDGINDLVVGQPWYGAGVSSILTASGLVEVFSGADGALLHSRQGLSPNALLGHSVDGCGDVNNDGFDDYIVGVPAFLHSTFGFIGQALVLSGFNGSVIYDFRGDNNVQLAYNVSGVGDVNNDGRPDFSVGCHYRLNPMPGENYSIRIHSGLGGHLIGSLPAPESNPDYTQRATGLGDLNGDGRDDLAVCSFVDSGDGEVRVYLSGADPVATFASQSGIPAQLNLVWEPAQGHINNTSGAIQCFGASAFASGIVLASLAPADIPVFGFDLLCAVDPTNLLLTATIGADSLGTFNAFGISRRNPIIAGSELFVQLIEVAPQVRASNGLKFTVIP